MFAILFSTIAVRRQQVILHDSGRCTFYENLAVLSARVHLVLFWCSAINIWLTVCTAQVRILVESSRCSFLLSTRYVELKNWRTVAHSKEILGKDNVQIKKHAFLSKDSNDVKGICHISFNRRSSANFVLNWSQQITAYASLSCSVLICISSIR